MCFVVRSESVFCERTQIDKVRPALNSFVRVHCFQWTDSLQSFALLWLAILAKIVRTRQQSLTAQSDFAPVLPFGQFAPFSVTLTSGKTAI